MGFLSTRSTCRGGLLFYVRYLKEEKERSKKASKLFQFFDDKLCDMFSILVIFI